MHKQELELVCEIQDEKWGIVDSIQTSRILGTLYDRNGRVFSKEEGSERIMIGGFDVIFYTLIFIIPGFIIFSVFSMFVKTKREKAKHKVMLMFFLLSCINYAICSWLIYLIEIKNFFDNIILEALLWGVIIFIIPLLIGGLAAYFSDKNIIKNLLETFGLNPIHIIPTAWDYKFSKIESPVWVLVTLQDGSRIAGIYGYNSFSSSESNERDIYIEKTYSISDGGEWQPVENTDGILICKDQIKYVEFWTD